MFELRVPCLDSRQRPMPNQDVAIYLADGETPAALFDLSGNPTSNELRSDNSGFAHFRMASDVTLTLRVRYGSSLSAALPFYTPRVISEPVGVTPALQDSDLIYVMVGGHVIVTPLSWFRDFLNTHDGLSAYELAVQEGFVGTLEEWLASLRGPQGPQGVQGPQGAQGPQGPQGEAGVIPDVYVGSDFPAGVTAPGILFKFVGGQLVDVISRES